jgi:hypothetical protein
MKTKYSLLCAAAVLPMAFSSVAHAQSAAPAAPEPDVGSYSLKGSALKAPVATYELTGTSISGSSNSATAILTAPVSQGALAYKTESGVYFYPTVFAGAGYNDNVQSAATNAIGSNFLNVAPQLVGELKHKGDRYTALVSLDSTSYSNSSNDNANKSEFELAGDNYFTSRARAGWSIGQVNGSDPRNATNFAPSAEIDRWHSTNLNGRLIYGAAEAQGRVEVDLGRQDKTYDNNRTVTSVADLTLTSVAARGFYRLGTRTQALIEFRDAKANYLSSLSTDSNTERRYYAGLTWEATAATTGIVKVGRMTKDFDLSSKAGFGGSSWEATVRWLPRTYSAFDLQTSRVTADPTGFGNYLLNTSTNLTWNHKWTQSLSSRVAVGVLNSEFVGTPRTDTINSYALTVDYAVMRWLKVGVDYANTDNSSTSAASSYKRNVTMLTLNATL